MRKDVSDFAGIPHIGGLNKSRLFRESFVRATARRNGRRTGWDNAAINYRHQIITPGFNCAYKITSRRLLPRVQYLRTLERSSAAEIPAR